jgi:hypothetical protein
MNGDSEDVVRGVLRSITIWYRVCNQGAPPKARTMIQLRGLLLEGLEQQTQLETLRTSLIQESDGNKVALGRHLDNYLARANALTEPVDAPQVRAPVSSAGKA